MINKLSKFIFFYLAYLPLILILLILNMEISWKLLFISIGIIILGIILVIPLLRTIKSVSPVKEKIEIIADNNSEVIGFIVTYITPFLIQFTNLNSIIAFSILMVIIFLIYVETSIFSINPLLKIIFGYNIYEVKSEDKRYYLLSKQKGLGGSLMMKVKQIDREVIIED
ncbi:hypothetical protein COU58_03505 [Candidatus Pacearchaeota archaeon CG10_big_fil_rev_8_21_14_0_10_32_42]|nr:MAG: hypothetical protein COU58_03505 [Candidatus Pacearchaeota archaeon CG10_big_fil_rev_8_21_14_0_10_32_42]